MERQAAIVRWWLLAITGCLLCFWSPEYAILPLAMAGLGNFPGCDPCCSPELCNLCNPACSNHMQIVVAGMTNGTCATCTDFNGTFELTITGTPTVTICIWRYTYPTTCGVGTALLDFYVFKPTSNYFTQGWVLGCGGTDAVRFETAEGSSKPDCTAFSGKSLTRLNTGFTCPGTGKTCTGTSATFVVTAL